MPNVCHFIRKSSQFQKSFIHNQITNHVNYNPYIVYRLNNNENSLENQSFQLNTLQRLDLNSSSSIIDEFYYKFLKILSDKQQKIIHQFLCERKIDVAHFHFGTDCGIFYPFLNRMQIPKIVSFYGYDISSFPQYLWGLGKRYLKNRVFKQVDLVLAMSEDMKKDLMNSGCPEKKIIIHYYGTDCKRFFHQRKYYQKYTVRILTISNMCPKKGHIFQFEAIKQLVKSGVTNFHFRVAGSGEIEKQLKDYVYNNNLTPYIEFIGPLIYGSQEMILEYNKADIFLHPSVIADNGDKEGIPGTIIEAMSSGLPVISTYHAGIPSIIKNNKTGILVNEWDVNGLKKEIIRLIDNVSLRKKIGEMGQDFVLKELDLEIKEKELEAIYTNAINHNN